MNRHERNWLEACADLGKRFSTCSRRQYFAVILAPNNRVVGTGYNGSPPGMAHCIDGACPRGRSTLPSGAPYDGEVFCIAQHAEAGALLWSDPGLRQGGTLIVNGTPCIECARLIASSGIKRVIGTDDGRLTWPTVRDYLHSAGIETEIAGA